MKLFTALFIFLSVQSYASSPALTCYEITVDKNNWPKQADLVCVDEESGADTRLITWENGNGSSHKTIARFYLNVTLLSKCKSCHWIGYGVAEPMDSAFNQVSIVFNGERDSNGEASGKLQIGTNEFFYRSKK
jgi:hypothetical protein